jgi:hypothetical protein
MNNQSPAEGLRQQLILLDRAMVSTDDNYPIQYHIPLDDLIEFVTAYAATVEREARKDEVEMVISMAGKTMLKDGTILPTNHIEGGNPNMIDVDIPKARLAALQGPQSK